MTDDRLPTSLWLEAHLRIITRQGTPYTIINKGSPSSGLVLLKIYAPGEGALLMQQQRNPEGEMGWMRLFKGETRPESEVDAYIQRSVERDPDLWAIEIEDKEKKNPFEGKIF